MNNEIIISNHTPQDITIEQQDNQLIFINGGGEVIGVTDVKVNGISVVENNIAYVITPTKLSQLQNDTHFISTETDPAVSSVVKSITLADINNWNSKQDELVSGSNIKTINNTSILGNGNIDISSGSNYSAGTGIDITNDVISNTITSYNDLSDLPNIPTKITDLQNDSDFVSANDLAEVAFTGGYGSLSNTPEYTSDFINDGNGTHPFLLNNSSSYIEGIGTLGGATAQSRNLAYTWDNGVVQEAHTIANYDDLTNELATKQNTLVSGTNIKTINNNSILGSGNISISGGSATDVQINGTSIVSNDIANIITESIYNSTTNKIATKNDIPTTTSQLTNDSGYVTNEYSTSEIVIGKWINNKPIYRKCINITLPNTTQITINSGLSNVETIINLYGYTSNGSATIPLMYNNLIYSGGTYFYYDNGNIILGCTFDGSTYSGYVILEYTKTTD